MTKLKHYIDSIYYDLELTASVLKVLGAQLFEQLGVGISPVEHAALDTIFCNTGICQRDLAKLILKDRACTGRILDSLEEKGLITRFVDVKNNRLVKKMGLTEAGHKKVLEVHDKIEGYLQTVSAQVPEEEIEQLQNALRKFRENILATVNMNI